MSIIIIIINWICYICIVMPLADDSSDDSQSDSVSETDDADLRSTTSLEDMSRLTANMLLYKAARARNIAVMLDALAQFADINWKNNEDCGRTPLMQAIFSVRMLCCLFLSVWWATLSRGHHCGTVFAAGWRPEMMLHTFKWQLKCYLFHDWSVNEQKWHSPPPSAAVVFFCDFGTF